MVAVFAIQQVHTRRTSEKAIILQSCYLDVLGTMHYVCRRRDRRDFVAVMKYFRHILMGNEIFFKIFDGAQNIFLSSIFVILFFKLRRLEHKISKLAIKEI